MWPTNQTEIMTQATFLNITQSLINPSQMTHNLSLTIFFLSSRYIWKYSASIFFPAVSNQCRAKLTHRTLSFRDLVRFYQNIPARLVEHVVCSYKWVLWSVNPHQPLLVNYGSSHGKMTSVADCRYVQENKKKNDILNVTWQSTECDYGC